MDAQTASKSMNRLCLMAGAITIMACVHSAGAAPMTLVPLTTSSRCANGELDSGSPAISADGKCIVFQSNCDLTGGNSDGNPEIFRFDTGTNTLTQLTNSTECNNGDIAYGAPALSADGKHIALVSSCDPAGGNPDHNFEVFGLDSATGKLTQLTASSDCGNWGTAVSANGSHIAFASSCDLTGGNADHNAEIFTLDTTTHTMTQVTSSQGCSGNSDPVISSDGARISFVSSCNLTGENADGNHEIFGFDASNGLRQITDSSGCENFSAAASGDGRHLAFVSTCDLTGGNADANFEIFRFDVDGGRLTQVTTSTGCGNSHPAISADGTRIVFDSSCDLTGTNADANWEIFRFDGTTRTVTAITSSGDCMGNFVPAVSADTGAAVFASYCNLTNEAPGGANDNLEIVLAQSRLRRVRPSVGTQGHQGRSQRVRP